MFNIWTTTVLDELFVETKRKVEAEIEKREARITRAEPSEPNTSCYWPRPSRGAGLNVSSDHSHWSEMPDMQREGRRCEAEEEEEEEEEGHRQERRRTTVSHKQANKEL